ncbi:ATP phosphoribosyltransferase regulatory subunit [Ideonella livida]|uniref:ATP phosphoribosyltransferase regulatory subunit n=1 Tax=Ideonella livida TaxID=2707176 RepID=A0A7C9PFL0_9BURK|nr:ATP phosphoribosyltransferase regulatory subunit [Ideonella livida]NDY90696.1 ATP phosphoribosyltransferase regulatory subunit [Ideonella livida]
MSSAWLLPEHLADVLPSEARRIEELRRLWLDLARAHGFELVMPPLLEHLESLLSGTGRELDLKTFKLVDQLSGRTLGLRADTTPQVARIDAHLLNRRGVTRLCYCGPVLHALPAGLHVGREPLQLGVEIFGHAGLEAELEVMELVLDGLAASGVKRLTVDLGDARIVRALLARAPAGIDAAELVAALTAKDQELLARLSAEWPETLRRAVLQLPDLYGGEQVLERARGLLPQDPVITQALDDLAWLCGHLRASCPDVRVGFDLADMSGYAYYSGVRFAAYGEGAVNSLARGGRYDEVGAVFGRRRPAVGASLDLKLLSPRVGDTPPRAAIRAPWGEDPGLRAAVRRLRQDGETVVCVLPGHEHETDEFLCDRELFEIDGRWALRAL